MMRKSPTTYDGIALGVSGPYHLSHRHLFFNLRAIYYAQYESKKRVEDLNQAIKYTTIASQHELQFSIGAWLFNRHVDTNNPEDLGRFIEFIKTSMSNIPALNSGLRLKMAQLGQTLLARSENSG
jgi:hypothetical protein